MLQFRENQGVAMFEAWDIGVQHHEWKRQKRENSTTMRFGQWFMNRHQLTEPSELFYEENSEKAKSMILHLIR